MLCKFQSAIDTWVGALRVHCPPTVLFLHTNVFVFFELERQCFEQGQFAAKAGHREKAEKVAAADAAQMQAERRAQLERQRV